MKHWLIAGALALAPVPALANGYLAPVTVGGSDSVVLATGASLTNSMGRSWLDLINDSPTDTICINFGAAATISGTVCAVAGAIPDCRLCHGRSCRRSGRAFPRADPGLQSVAKGRPNDLRRI
jgi:hypothetical protein